MPQRNVQPKRNGKESTGSRILVKRLVIDGKERVGEDFGRKIRAMDQSKKLKERKVREIEGRKNNICRIKRSDAILVKKSEEVKVWKIHFEFMLNKGDRESKGDQCRSTDQCREAASTVGSG